MFVCCAPVFVPKTIKQVFPVIHIGSLVLEGDWVYYATLILMIVVRSSHV